jgi:hypothetical protein
MLCLLKKQNNFRKGKTEIKQHPWQQKRQFPKVSKSVIPWLTRAMAKEKKMFYEVPRKMNS